MSKPIKIPNGAILNCYLPKRRWSLKRGIMNVEARLIKKTYGFKKLLNHTALIERQGKNVLIWEAAVKRGISPTALPHYTGDAVFIITTGTNVPGNEALDYMKSQAGIGYDFKSWSVYLRFLISGKWSGGVSYSEYKKKWYCSEIVDECYKLSGTPFKSTPNHVYSYTSSNEIWAGTYSDLLYGIKTESIIIENE